MDPRPRIPPALRIGASATRIFLHKRLCKFLPDRFLASKPSEIPISPIANPPVKLADVAQAAGVSVSTASRALNGRDKEFRISHSTVDRVRRAADQLGFRPSRVARSLQSQRTGLIGIAVPDISNAFFSAIAREVTLAAEARGYSVLLADSQESTDREIKLVQEFMARQVEALVVCPVGIESGHLIDVHQSRLPIVIVDRVFPDCEMVQVTSDHQDGAYQAAKSLLIQGHQTIGVLQGLPGTLPNERRLAGLKSILTDTEVGWDPSLVKGDNFTESSGHESAHALLTARPDITALVALSAPNAFGALRAAAELGRRVPTELSIVAFDDSPFADFMSVPLSTVRQDVQRLGELASSLVMQSVDAADQPKAKLHQVDVRFIQRHSISKAIS